MSLQIVVAVETGRALVTLARLVVGVRCSRPRAHAVHLVRLHSGVWVTLHWNLSNHHLSIGIVEAALHELPRETWKAVAVVRAIEMCRTRWGLHRVRMIA